MNKFFQARIVILVLALVFSLLAIYGFPPKFSNEGVSIEGIQKNSAAELAGIIAPDGGVSPVNKEVIRNINGFPIITLSDYYLATKDLQINNSVIIETDRSIYSLKVIPEYREVETGETRIVEVNEEINGTNITSEVEIPVTERVLVGPDDLGLLVGEAATTNIKKGLDLSGGTRVILRPEEAVDDDTFDSLVESTKQRLNVFGLADIQVRPVESGILGGGERFISVEIPGTSQKEVIELLTTQGKFEAQIANQTVFRSGNDITSVCKVGSCLFIGPCGNNGEDVSCSFRFSITLSNEAAKRQAEVTRELPVINDGTGEGYLSEDIFLILDDEVVDQLKISSNLKGVAATEISISGSGSGRSESEAREDAAKNMKQLQTLLESGNLPVKLEIVKTDQLSPTLGKEFLSNIMLIGILVVIAVIGVVFLRYRKIVLALPIAITMLSEVIIILGVASFIKWSLDLAAVAGILIAIGTGVDDQIVIIDESFSKGKMKTGTWKDKMKKAFFIIMAAYFTTIVAMLPLLTAGAGLLKGFAITTIIGVSIGVFITRPAFAKLIELFTNQ